MICRFYKQDEGNKLNVNISCDVVKMDDRDVTIQGIKSKEEGSFYENIIDEHFTYAYCATCHSRQETTIRDSKTVHKWNKYYLVAKEWMCCAMT